MTLKVAGQSKIYIQGLCQLCQLTSRIAENFLYNSSLSRNARFFTLDQVFNQSLRKLCFKTLKLLKFKIFVKCLVKDVKQGALYDVIFLKFFKKSFKVIYRNQTTIETSTFPAICIFKRSNPILKLIFQISEFFCVTSLSPNGLKRDQSSISSIEGNRKVEINVW